MTTDEFNRLTFTKKLPFKIQEALHQILVHNINYEDVLTNCGINSPNEFDTLEEALYEVHQLK